MNACFYKASHLSYLPEEDTAKFRNETAEFYLKKAKKDKDNADLSNFCIEQAIDFSFSKELISKAASWILDGKVTVDDEELKCELTLEQKYTIVRKQWASSEFSPEEKKALREKIFETDQSDAGNDV